MTFSVVFLNSFLSISSCFCRSLKIFYMQNSPFAGFVSYTSFSCLIAMANSSSRSIINKAAVRKDIHTLFSIMGEGFQYFSVKCDAATGVL